MSSYSDAWWAKETVQKTLHSASELSISKEKIVAYLEEEFSDVGDRRIQAIIDAGLPDYDEPDDPPYPESTEQSPRGLEPRHLDVVDTAYLSDRELARVVAAGLQRVQGTARAVTETGLAVDVIWNRSHTTAALRTVSCDRDASVGEDVIQDVIEGDVAPESGRAPSTVAVVTNGTYTEAAERVATAGDVHLVAGGQLQRWFSLFRLTPDLYGPILEEGELVETDTDELLDEAPTLPRTLRDVDLFDLSGESLPATPESTIRPESDRLNGSNTGGSGSGSGGTKTGGGSSSGRAGGVPVPDPEPEPGEYGRLYADPEEDGDYDAIDRLLEAEDDQ